MTTILVTGCAGFIGSHVADFYLQKCCKVIGIDNFDPFYDRSVKLNNLSGALLNPLFVFHEFDLSDINALNKITDKVDVVIHLAAKAGVRPSILDPAAYIKANICATQNVLEWMKQRKFRKLIFASSSSVYGNNKKTPFSETDVVDHPISPYAFTKKACELLVHTDHHLYGIDAICLRFFTVYGERQRPDLAIHKFVKLALNNKAITMFGDGETARDYTYIHDIVQGIDGAVNCVMKNEHVYEIVNIGNNSPVKLNQLISAIYALLKTEPRIIHEPMQAGDVEITYADISKANALFNYQPATELNTGLSNFIEWFKRSVKV